MPYQNLLVIRPGNRLRKIQAFKVQSHYLDLPHPAFYFSDSHIRVLSAERLVKDYILKQYRSLFIYKKNKKLFLGRFELYKFHRIFWR